MVVIANSFAYGKKRYSMRCAWAIVQKRVAIRARSAAVFDVRHGVRQYRRALAVPKLPFAADAGEPHRTVGAVQAV